MPGFRAARRRRLCRAPPRRSARFHRREGFAVRAVALARARSRPDARVLRDRDLRRTEPSLPPAGLRRRCLRPYLAARIRQGPPRPTTAVPSPAPEAGLCKTWASLVGLPGRGFFAGGIQPVLLGGDLCERHGGWDPPTSFPPPRAPGGN